MFLKRIKEKKKSLKGIYKNKGDKIALSKSHKTKMQNQKESPEKKNWIILVKI